jgi:hypothetical protein
VNLSGLLLGICLRIVLSKTFCVVFSFCFSLFFYCLFGIL